MKSFSSAVVSAVVNVLLLAFGVTVWWLALILFFGGWLIIWLLIRMGINGEGLGEAIGNLGEGVGDLGSFGDGGSSDSGGGWGGSD